MSSQFDPALAFGAAAADATACFHVQARAEPSVMPRVMDQFARRGLVPTQWHSSLGGRDGETLLIDLQMQDFAPAQVARVAACLRQIVEVDSVLVSRKRVAGGR